MVPILEAFNRWKSPTVLAATGSRKYISISSRSFVRTAGSRCANSIRGRRACGRGPARSPSCASRARTIRALIGTETSSASLLGQSGAAQTCRGRLLEQVPVLPIAPGAVDPELGKRVDLRIELERLSKCRLGFVQIAFEAQCSSEAKMRNPRPRVCGTGLDQQINRLIHPVQQQLAPAHDQVGAPHGRVAWAQPQRFFTLGQAGIRMPKEQ
jgi:hypothetical protein